MTLPVHLMRLRPPVEPPLCWAVRLSGEDLDEVVEFAKSFGARVVTMDRDYLALRTEAGGMQCAGPTGTDRWLLVRQTEEPGVYKFEMRDDGYVRARWEEVGP